LGDVDGDGDLDALVGNGDLGTLGQANAVWVNDGTGQFTDGGQHLGRAPTRVVALVDLDGDGDLDAFVDNHTASQVWVNDGAGRFSDSGQRLRHASEAVVNVGDVDGDGNADVFATRYERGYRVWDNDGRGHYVAGGMPWGWGTLGTVGVAVAIGALGAWWFRGRRRGRADVS
jgi:hypothetical protein